MFGVFRLEADGRLYRGDTLIPLSSLELIALQALLAHAGRVVSPSLMRQTLWGTQHAAAADLAGCIASLRARLEPHAAIEVVYKRGFRLTAEVRPQSVIPLPILPRLVIMPLAVHLGVPEYLGVAITEETASRLSSLSRPAVASISHQDSVLTLARRGLSPHQIGSMLEADLVLSGTLRALPSHYRLEARMIRVSDGSQLWVEHLFISRGRIAGLERELADRVTFRLQEGNLSIVAEVASAPPDADPLRREAWETYQQAHQEWQSSSATTCRMRCAACPAPSNLTHRSSLHASISLTCASPKPSSASCSRPLLQAW